MCVILCILMFLPKMLMLFYVYFEMSDFESKERCEFGSLSEFDHCPDCYLLSYFIHFLSQMINLCKKRITLVLVLQWCENIWSLQPLMILRWPETWNYTHSKNSSRCLWRAVNSTSRSAIWLRMWGMWTESNIRWSPHTADRIRVRWILYFKFDEYRPNLNYANSLDNDQNF